MTFLSLYSIVKKGLLPLGQLLWFARYLSTTYVSWIQWYYVCICWLWKSEWIFIRTVFQKIEQLKSWFYLKENLYESENKGQAWNYPGCPFLAFLVRILGQKYLWPDSDRIANCSTVLCTRQTTDLWPWGFKSHSQFTYSILNYILTSLWHWERILTCNQEALKMQSKIL